MTAITLPSIAVDRIPTTQGTEPENDIEPSLLPPPSYATASPSNAAPSSSNATPASAKEDVTSDEASKDEELVWIDETSGSIVSPLTPAELASLLVEANKAERDPVAALVVVDAEFTIVSPTLVPLSSSSDSNIVTAAEYLAYGIVSASKVVGQGIEGVADLVVLNTKASQTPIVFSERTTRTIEASHSLTTGAFDISATALGMISTVAGRLGGAAGSRLGLQTSPDAPPPTGLKAFAANTIIGVTTVVDALEEATQNLIESTTTSTSSIVQHTLGRAAMELSNKLGGSLKNVVRVYTDARGITRRALLQSVGGATRSVPRKESEIVITPVIEKVDVTEKVE